jgi:hypothetical protein
MGASYAGDRILAERSQSINSRTYDEHQGSIRRRERAKHCPTAYRFDELVFLRTSGRCVQSMLDILDQA